MLALVPRRILRLNLSAAQAKFFSDPPFVIIFQDSQGFNEDFTKILIKVLKILILYMA